MSEDCSTDDFQYHLNYFCILGENNFKTTGFLALTLVIIAINIYLIREGKVTKQKLLTLNSLMDATYSIFHLRII